ncbi:MAG: DUF3267 domain-containing protein [Solobacterium sp.]|nr:DUF3267 domain-containing protein [Solobacterium sp.]
MNCIQKLPEGYEVIRSVDLQKDKKAMLTVNGIALVLTLVLFVIMNSIYSLPKWIVSSLEDGTFFFQLIALAIAAIAYVILHEITHGITMKSFGGKEVRYGFTGMYAYAGSQNDWFSRNAYICIALAPLVVWGIIFFVLPFLFPKYTWIFWFLQIFNVSGAAGDMYVTWLSTKMPASVYVRDTGVDMAFFDKKNS